VAKDIASRMGAAVEVGTSTRRALSVGWTWSAQPRSVLKVETRRLKRGCTL
jgi:hypothetical protein